MSISDGRQDFDFLFGDWKVAHRRLRKRLAGSADWEEFPGTCTVRPMLGGVANFDENVIALPGGAYEASTLRLFDVARRRWSIYWLDARNSGRIDPPVHGGFEGGEGLFLGDDAHEGTPVRVRFRWSSIAPDHCRWDQAFSADGGAGWETNWIMDFHRG